MTRFQRIGLLGVAVLIVIVLALCQSAGIPAKGLQALQRSGQVAGFAATTVEPTATPRPPEPTATPRPPEPTPALPPGGITPSPEVKPPADTCRGNIWLDEAIVETADVAGLIALLDRDFTLSDGGQWSEPGYTVPGGSVFWTDLFENRTNLPAGVSAIRTQGGWGVYYASSDYVVPVPNGGGRWMRLCDPFTTVPVEPPAGEATEPEAAPPVALVCQVPDLTGLTVVQAIKAMDDWFQEEGYQFGSAFAVGDTLPAGAIFWTNLGEGYIVPSHITPIRAEGNWGVFMTTQAFTAPSGGRYAVCNS